MGKTIVIASGKGGTGKTMVSANLGATLSKRGYRVLLMDMDTGLRNLDLYLGLENNVVYDVTDVMNGVCRIKQAIIKDKTFPGLNLMAASPKRSTGDLTPLHMKVLCEKLEEMFDYIIVDAPAGLDDDFMIALGAAEHVILVINPEIASMRDGELVRQLLLYEGRNNIHYIVNKLHLKLMKAGLAPSIEEVSRHIRKQIIGLIPYDENVHISTNLGIPIAFLEDHYIAKDFERIADRVEKL